MNHVLHAGAETVRYGWLLGVTTALFIACFVGWCSWAFAAHNRDRLNQAARLPLDSEDDA